MLAAVRRRALRKRPGHQLGVQSPQPPLALNGENVDATTMVYRFGSRRGSEHQIMETSCPSSRNRFVFMQHPFSSRRETLGHGVLMCGCEVGKHQVVLLGWLIVHDCWLFVTSLLK